MGFVAAGDVFRSVRKIAKSFVSVGPVRMVQLGSHWTDFHEIWYLRIFGKSVEIIQFGWKGYVLKHNYVN